MIQYLPGKPLGLWGRTALKCTPPLHLRLAHPIRVQLGIHLCSYQALMRGHYVEEEEAFPAICGERGREPWVRINLSREGLAIYLPLLVI